MNSVFEKGFTLLELNIIIQIRHHKQSWIEMCYKRRIIPAYENI